MTIRLSMPNAETELKPRITVVGVGGAGGNAVNNMIRSNLEGVDFVVCNTDSQALNMSLAERRIQLGVTVTQGLGAGSRPEIGRAAAEEALEELLDHLSGNHMVFVTAGMGGGTGTGAAPVIARAAREAGMLTVGVITKPFHFEGTHRMRTAEAGIDELQQYVDTLIIIPNQNLFRVANEKTTFADAFKMADDVLYSGVRGVTDLMVMPGLINLDFADIRTVMSEMGKAMMGTGEADGDDRATRAAESAISNPLLDDITMDGARGVLINITGGPDMTLFEVDEAANRIREEVDPDANILFGSTFDETMEGRVRVSVVATGIDANATASGKPLPFGRPKPGGSRPSRPEAEAPVRQVAESAVAIPAPLNEPAPIAATPAEAPAQAWSSPQPGAEATAMAVRLQEPAEQTFEQAGPEPMAPRRAPFIPPRPMAPGEMGADRKPGERRPAEPFAAAAMENGPGNNGPLHRKRLSLFERMTGAGRRKDETAGPARLSPKATLGRAFGTTAQAPDAGAPQGGPRAAGMQSSEPAPGQARPMPTAAERAPERHVQSHQPQLGGLETDDRLSLSQAEEEMLDIPAFLRRQAN